MWRTSGNKFGAKKTEYNGILYDSKKEALYAYELDLRVRCKEIDRWDRQIKIPLKLNDILICTYVCDFKIIHLDKREELVEIKSEYTQKLPVYRLKRKLLQASYLKSHPEITYTVVAL